MIIVCDSSPLFALAICDKLDLLEKLYDTVLLPLAVYRESTIKRKNRMRNIACIFAVITLLLVSGCNRHGSSDVTNGATRKGATAEFEAFVRRKSTMPQQPVKEAAAEDVSYRLCNGRLSISGAKGSVLWQSPDIWWVDDFSLGHITGEDRTELLFSLWKSYSFATPPARLSNDDASVKNHLFLYTVKNGYAKQVWCSSNLPRPIYRFELDPNGRKTPVSSGMRLFTIEGAYTDDYHETEALPHVYTWEGWGFVPQD
ncbi:hypothetical protein FACS1894200_10670 [Spirochaetia bacterium]|nr:hypothetical protein FACS1894200_10670 [Spirochaetia bacterium]